MSEGTSISSLETGAVSDKADNALMNQILADIGNAGGDVKTSDAPQTIQNMDIKNLSKKKGVIMTPFTYIFKICFF